MDAPPRISGRGLFAAVEEWLLLAVNPAPTSDGVRDAPPVEDPFASYPRADVVAALCEVSAVLIVTLDDALAEGGDDWVESAIDVAASLLPAAPGDDERRAMRNLARDLRRGGATTAELLAAQRATEVAAAVFGLIPGLVLMTAAIGDVTPAAVAADVVAPYRR